MRFSDTIINAQAYSPPSSDTVVLNAPAGDPSAALMSAAPVSAGPSLATMLAVAAGVYFLFIRK